MSADDEGVNGHQAPGIVVVFGPDGTPSIQLVGGVSPTQIAGAAVWLADLASVQIRGAIVQQLQPRVRPVGIG